MDGRGDAARPLFPALDTIAAATGPPRTCAASESGVTTAAFRYFTGGDLPGTADPGFPAWHAIEAAVAAVVGKVDVHVVNQHGSIGEESEPFLRTLHPRC